MSCGAAAEVQGYLCLHFAALSIGMQDLTIDLTLAVNYVPACACAVQSVALSFVLCALHSVRLLPAFVAVCLLLVVDRSSRPGFMRIFDGSSVLFSIFLAHCVDTLQEFGASAIQLWPVFHVIFSLEWPCCAMYLLLKPPDRRDLLRVWLFFSCFRVSCCAFLHRPDTHEHRLVRVGRDMAFAGLCMVWTYVVGLYRRRLTQQPTESAVHFAIYFWPVLYTHWYAAGLYAVAAFCVIVLQLKQPAQQPDCCEAPPQQKPYSSTMEQEQAEGPAENDDETLFRQAMSARTGGL